MINIS